MAKETVVCDRVWLLYLQGRLSPAQLLALCKLPETNESRPDVDPQAPAA
ncbi:MAG: hypothetical protein AAGI45_20590 [Cyanobacteria bacterium P01_H01_bin.26]